MSGEIDAVYIYDEHKYVLWISIVVRMGTDNLIQRPSR